MDSECGDMIFEDEDSENEIEEEEEDDFVDMEPEASTNHPKHDEEEFPFQVLTADEIVKHMVDCIKEVNSVVQVSCLPVEDLSCIHYRLRHSPEMHVSLS